MRLVNQSALIVIAEEGARKEEDEGREEAVSFKDESDLERLPERMTRTERS